MGLLGLIVGIALGLLFNYPLSRVGIDFTAFSSVASYTALISGRVYSTMGTEKLVQRAVLVLIISILASFYPAIEAAQHEPAKSLHYV